MQERRLLFHRHAPHETGHPASTGTVSCDAPEPLPARGLGHQGREPIRAVVAESLTAPRVLATRFRVNLENGP